ncbi:unnamed protein product [Arabidopsis lyrata]|nr:unnamed protein product [Arabidopsis lyrata]
MSQPESSISHWSVNASSSISAAIYISPMINKGDGNAEKCQKRRRREATPSVSKHMCCDSLAFGFGLLENIVEDDDGVSQFLLNFTGMAMSGNLTDEIPGGERNQRNNITCHEEEHKGFQIGGLEPKGFAHGSV